MQLTILNITERSAPGEVHGRNIIDPAGMSKFDSIFKKIDRQKYPFVDGLYYLFIIVFILILFLFFA